MTTLLKQAVLLVLLITFYLPIANAAGANNHNISAGCKSCLHGYDCSRTNKTCNATCRANLYTESIDLESCRASCIKVLESCLLDANKSCDFYCKSAYE